MPLGIEIWIPTENDKCKAKIKYTEIIWTKKRIDGTISVIKVKKDLKLIERKTNSKWNDITYRALTKPGIFEKNNSKKYMQHEYQKKWF
jgi:hypothetical protein